MTTIYKFKAGYTKLGAATAPSSAPTITVVDSADNILVAALTATTALANLVGAYLYSYSGADGLDLVGKFTTTDATMDAQDLFSIPDVFSVMPTAAALATLQGNVTTILADYARRTGDYATVAAVAAIFAVVDTEVADIKAKTDQLVFTIANQVDANALTTSYGPGAAAYTITINDSGGLPIDGVNVWITTDIAGANVIFNGYTNALGVVSPMLDAGNYFAWKQKAGYTFTNPQSFSAP